MAEKQIKAFVGAQPPISDKEAAEMAESSSSTYRMDPRKVEAKKRFDIYSESFRKIIVDRIKATHESHETQHTMAKFVDVTMNPALDMARQLCMLWREPVKREVIGENIQSYDEKNSSFQDMYHKSWIDVYAPMWNQQAFLVGPVIVMPMPKDGRIVYKTLLPHYYDVMVDPDNINGSPLAVSWSLKGESAEKEDFDTVVADSVSYRYYRTDRSKPVLVDTVEHGVGAFPGATLRFSVDPQGDWYNIDQNQRLIDGTVIVGVISAALSFTRKAQNKKLLVAIGDVGEKSGYGQRLDPEIPVYIRTDSAAQVNLQVADFDTNPDNFIKHALWVYQSLAEAYGATTVYMGNGASGGGLESGRFDFTLERLTEIRNEQLPYARAFEYELAWKSVAALHKDQKFTSPIFQTKEVMDGFHVEFPKLSRTYADPMSEVTHMEALMRHGVVSNLDFIRKYYPYMSDEELEAKMKANLEQVADVNDMLASRNLSLNPETSQAETAAQVNGRIGGGASPNDRFNGNSDTNQ